MQNGKFAACALLEFVNALNKLIYQHLATNNSTLKTHYLLFTVLENKSNFFSTSIEIESVIFLDIFSIPSISSSSKFCKT